MKFQYSLATIFYKDPQKWSPTFFESSLMRYQTFLLKTVGMCDIDFGRFLPSQLKFISHVLNFLIFAFFSFIHIHLALLFVQDMINSDQLHRITNAITMIIINSFAFFTLLYYKLNNKKYLKMVDYMDENFKARSEYGLTFMTGERSYIVAHRYTFWWTLMCMCGTLQWILMPLFKKERTLPIPVKYPVNEMVKTKRQRVEIE